MAGLKACATYCVARSGLVLTPALTATSRAVSIRSSVELKFRGRDDQAADAGGLVVELCVGAGPGGAGARVGQQRVAQVGAGLADGKATQEIVDDTLRRLS